ncbi:ATG13 family protein [Megaselia abdita]
MSQSNGNLEKDIEKFVKFLIYKFCNVVVQSRLGEKLETQCIPNATSNGWFNIHIQEHPNIQAETKNALNIQPNESIFSRLPISIEISLKTIDDDKMVLEVWTLDQSKLGEKESQQIKTAQSIYNRMTVLLKSLITLTRSTPAYKLSRRQSPDSYGIYYRIYVAPPQTHALGDGFKTVRIGQIGTLSGTLNVTVAYRTKMTISPTKVEIPNPIMVKSDHFVKDVSPKRNHLTTPVIDISKPMKPGPFVDTSKLKQYSEQDYILPEESPFSWIIRKKDGTIDYSVLTTVSSNSFSEENNNNTKNFEVINDSPAKSLFVPSEISPVTTTSKSDLNLEKSLMKELSFPFATTNNHIGELAKFYRDCYNAPQLHNWEEEADEEDLETPFKETSSQQPVDELTKQLQAFEICLDNYEKMLSSLGSSKSSTTSA